MIVDSQGRIAYHAYLFKDKGGMDFVQYGFNGEELYREEVRKPIVVDWLPYP